MTQIYAPPHDEENEKAVLASILIEPPCFRSIDKIIRKPQAFYILRHAWIYESMQRLALKKLDIDLNTVTSDLADRGMLAEIGPMYLQELQINAAPTAQNAATYAQLVADKWLSRRIHAAATKIAQIGSTASMDGDDKRTMAKTILADAFEGMERNKRESWSETIDSALTEMYERIWGEAQDFFSTGIPELDRLLDESLEPGRMIIVAAKRKRGKSTFMRGLALLNAKAEKPVGILSYEEREHNIAKTMLAREALSTVSTASLRRMVHKEGRETEAAAIYSRLVQKGNVLKNLPINAIYAGGWTVEDAVSEIERLRDIHGTRLFVVDYAQRIKESGKRDRRLELAHIGLELANAASRLGVTVLLGSQVNDEGRTREAEDLENETDAKILITADDVVISTIKAGQPIPVTFNLELNRHGPTGLVQGMFNGAHRLFTGADNIPLGNAFRD